MSNYDLIILGGGSAAFAAAIKAAELGARVALIEEELIGGTCVNRGCVPTKNLLYAGELISHAVGSPFPGLEFGHPQIDFAQLMSQKDNLAADMRQQKYAGLLADNPSITVKRGRAVFISPTEVAVGGDVVQAERYIIATGARPAIPHVKGLDGVEYIDSTSALELRELPQSLLIIGGRAVAVEFAQMFSRFGSKVTLLQRSERIVPEEEEEISSGLSGYLEEEGIEIHAGVRLLSMREHGGRKMVTAEVDETIREFSASQLLMATGRKPNSDSIGLEKAGVDVDERGFIIVDETMRTRASNVWAAGDVVGKPLLVTVAAHAGAVAAENALTGAERKVNLSAIPHAIFTGPSVASVGLTEAQAAQRGLRVKTSVLEFAMVSKAVAVRNTRGLIKMVVNEDDERVLGVHILGPQAAETIHEAALAVKLGLTYRDLAETIHVYPTFSEAIKLVAQAFSKNVAKLSCCAE